MQKDNSNRRRHSRYRLSPMYTPVRVKYPNEQEFELEGHAYNISEGGLQFELDNGIPQGTQVAIEVTLPMGPGPAGWDGAGPARTVVAYGNVIWMDNEEPGPVRMALAFTRFENPGDQERLRERLATGRYALAA